MYEYLTFKPNDHVHGHSHGMIHDNVTMFGTKVHISIKKFQKDFPSFVVRKNEFSFSMYCK
jgi:hypothetical protein